MDIDHNLILGCEFCKIFLDNKNSILSKLVYPENIDKINDEDFILIKYNNKFVYIVRDHVDRISKELWGRILYHSKQMFGYNSKLLISKNIVHWYAIVEE